MDQKNREKAERRLRLQSERRKLDLIEKQLNEERKQKLLQKELLRENIMNSLLVKQQQKDFEKQILDARRLESKRLVQQNAQREVDREKQYRKFFEDYDTKMQNRILKLSKYIDKTEGEKNRQNSEWVHKNAEEYKKQQTELDNYMKNWRKQVFLGYF